MKLQQFFLIGGALSIMALNSGCGDKQETKVYSVAKPLPEAPPAAPQNTSMPAAMPGGMPPSMSGAMPAGHPGVGDMSAASGEPTPEINIGTPPPHWEVQPPTSMRVASFLVKGDKGATADVSLVLLSGEAGGILGNVNRWQSQLGQPSLTADDVAKKTQHVNSPLGEMTVVDLQGLPPGADATKDGRIIAAIVLNEGMAYFFKMRGNAELAGVQKADFLQWISTVHVGGGKTNTDAKSPTVAAPIPNGAAAAGTPVSPK